MRKWIPLAVVLSAAVLAFGIVALPTSFGQRDKAQSPVSVDFFWDGELPESVPLHLIGTQHVELDELTGGVRLIACDSEVREDESKNHLAILLSLRWKAESTFDGLQRRIVVVLRSKDGNPWLSADGYLDEGKVVAGREGVLHVLVTLEAAEIRRVLVQNRKSENQLQSITDSVIQVGLSSGPDVVLGPASVLPDGKYVEPTTLFDVGIVHISVSK
jgi:hypothetical protein